MSADFFLRRSFKLTDLLKIYFCIVNLEMNRIREKGFIKEKIL